MLHSRPFRDSSLIVEVFTRNHGRVGLVARGGRRMSGKRGPGQRALLQPLQPLILTWQGSTDLVTLISHEANGPACTLMGENLYGALYMNELLLRLTTRHDAHPGLFDSYEQSLHRLMGAARMHEPLRLFEKQLLDDIGYGLNLESDYLGQPVMPEQEYDYRLETGAVPVSSELQQAEKTQGIRIYGHELLALSKAIITAENEPVIRRLLGSALSVVLGPKPLQTRELIKALHAGKNPGNVTD